MMNDSYSGAIDLNRLERRLECCAAIDLEHPVEREQCARNSVMDCVCPCIGCEETICNALTASVSEAMLASGSYR